MNRKNKRRGKRKTRKVQAVVFPAPLASILVIVGLVSLSYLWLGGRCEALGRSIKVLEIESQHARERCRVEEYKWANTTSLPNIERALAHHGLDMHFPDRHRIVEVPISLYTDGFEYQEVAGSFNADQVRVARND